MSTPTTEIHMPLLVIETRGEIVKSNFDEFATAIRTRLSEFNLNLQTEEEFDQAAEDIKRIKSAEEALKKAVETAFDDGDMARLKENLRALQTELSTARRTIERQVDQQKTSARSNIIEGALTQIQCAPSEREGYRAKVVEAIARMKNMDSMREKVRIEVTVINDNIGRSKKLLDEFESANGKTLTPDREKLEVTDHVTLATELRRRLERAESEAREKRLREEAAAARAAEAKARAEAEAAKKPTVDPRNPHNLPKPPKIEGIPTGANAAPPANVVPMHHAPEPQGQTASLTEDEEWAEVVATVKSAFALIKEHLERLIHKRNIGRLLRFRALVNAAWKSCKVEEVAP